MTPGSSENPVFWSLSRGRGSAGRASPCQGEGRGFESRRPLGTWALIERSAPACGGVAERRGNGLQSRLHGFKSRLHLGSAERERGGGSGHPAGEGRLAQR